MSFFSRFRHRSTDEPTLADDAVLVIDLRALPRWWPLFLSGRATYHVRVFRPGNAKPVVVMGDLGNDPDASITNICPHIMAVVADQVLGQPGAHLTRLEDHARWLTYYPDDDVFGERFCEVHAFEVLPGHQPPLVTVKYHQLRRREAEDLVGGALSRWERSDYTAARLQRRGTREIRVHPAKQ